MPRPAAPSAWSANAPHAQSTTAGQPTRRPCCAARASRAGISRCCGTMLASSTGSITTSSQAHAAATSAPRSP
eukprot:1861010-Prymnesium_polylepis.1